MQSVLETLDTLHVALAGEQVPPRFSWLYVFENDDLVRMEAEVFRAVGAAVSGAVEWSEAEALVHEWQESAIVAESGILRAALDEDSDEEYPLLHPGTVFSFQETSIGATKVCPESKNQ